MAPAPTTVVVVVTSTHTTQPTATSTSASSSSGGGMSTGAICGAVIGSVVGALLIGIGIWIAVRGRKRGLASGGIGGRGGRAHDKGRSVDSTAKYEGEGETYEIGARGYRAVPNRKHTSPPPQPGSLSRTGLESFVVTPLSWPPSRSHGPVGDSEEDGDGERRMGGESTRYMGSGNGNGVRRERNERRHERTSSDTAPLLPRMEVTGDGRMSLDIDPHARLSKALLSVQSKSLPPAPAPSHGHDEPDSDVARLLKSRAEALAPLATSKDARADTFDTLRSSTVDSTSRSLTVDTIQLDAVQNDLGDPARWYVDFGKEPFKPEDAPPVLEVSREREASGDEEEGEDDDDEPDSPGSIYSQASYQDSDLPPWLLSPTDPLYRSGSAKKANLERGSSRTGSGRRGRKLSRRGPRAALRMDTVPELPDSSSLAPSPSGAPSTPPTLKVNVPSPPTTAQTSQQAGAPTTTGLPNPFPPAPLSLPIPSSPSTFPNPHSPATSRPSSLLSKPPSIPSRPPSVPSKPPSVPSRPPSNPSTPSTPSFPPIPQNTASLPPLPPHPYPLLSTGSAAFLPPSPTLTRDRLSVGSSLSSATSVSGWGVRYPSIAVSTIGGGSSGRSGYGTGSGSGSGSGSGRSGYASSAGPDSGSGSGSAASSRQGHLTNPTPAPTSNSHITTTTAHQDQNANARRQRPQSELDPSQMWRNPPAGLGALANAEFMGSSARGDQLQHHPRSHTDPSQPPYHPSHPRSQTDTSQPRSETDPTHARAHLRRPSAHHAGARVERGEVGVRERGAERLVSIDVTL